MSKADLDRFVADLKTNKDLQKAVAKGAGGLQAALAVAKAHGYNVTIDEARTYLRSKMANLSNNELDALAGGKGATNPFPQVFPKQGSVQVNTNSLVVTQTAEALEIATSGFIVAEGAIVVT